MLADKMISGGRLMEIIIFFKEMIPIITTNAINCNKQASVELGHNGTITYQYDLVNSVARLREVEASEGQFRTTNWGTRNANN